MSNEFSSLKELFRGILVAVAVPAAGCGASSTLPTGTPDAGEQPDVVVPVDTGGCAPIPMPGCPTSVIYPCGIPEITPGGENGVNIGRDRCRVLCAPAYPMGWEGPSCTANRATVGGNGARVQCDTCVIGRRVEGFAPRASDGGDLVGRFFAAAAQLEAASVVAFRTLAAELRALGAPDELVRDALAAAEEERRHARVTRAIARDRGAAPARVHLPLRAPRSMDEVASENAVEGCVRETFGALVAHWQRDHATDRMIRAAMEVIAEDETSHAALAWRAAAWLDAQLDEGARMKVRAARDAAVDSLARELDAEVPAALIRDAGMPPRESARALLDGLRAARWS